MSLREFLEPRNSRLSVWGAGVPILWWVYDLACHVAQKCQGVVLWDLGFLIHYMSLRLTIFFYSRSFPLWPGVHGVAGLGTLF